MDGTGGSAGEDVVRRTGLEATMPDGTVLVADAWHPTGSGPWPVLVQRLPYGRSVASTPVLPHPSWFARQGFAVVVQDCRGRGDSGGVFRPFVDEAADGAATIEWAARLPFVDGRVATYGFSYQGLAQLYAAAERPPSLRAIAPMMCCPDPYEGWTYEGGLRRWPFVCFWAAQLAGQSLGSGPIPFDVHARPITSALGADPPPWFTEWLDHPADDAYWAARRPDLDAIDVPAFTVLGWFDDFSSGTAELIRRLDAEAWCGPWAHMPWGTRHGGVEFGPSASPAPVWEALVAFFHRAFERPGSSAPGGDERVRYFVLGDGWKVAPTWPPAHEIVRLAAVSTTGNANSRWGDGRLVAAGAPAAYSGGLPTVIVAEPLFPHPGEPLDHQDDAGAQDRRDVACFTTEPFPDAVDVVGSPVVRAVTRTDRPAHDLVATLTVVSPDGTARALTGYGARRLDPAPPGTDLDWQMTLRPVAVRVPAGHRLRLALSGARFPCYDRPDDPAAATITVVRAEVELPVSPDARTG